MAGIEGPNDGDQLTSDGVAYAGEAAQAGAGGGDEVAVATAALNGVVTYPDTSCNQTTSDGVSFKTIIEQAMQQAWSNLVSSKMSDCMEQAILNWTGDSPDRVLARVKENMPTEVRCADLAYNRAGQAPVGISNERLTLDNAFVSSKNYVQIASVILHEVAHNKGYTHPNEDNSSPSLAHYAAYDYQSTVPEQIQACSLSISQGDDPAQPFGDRRYSIMPATTLAPVGGMGGNPFRMACDVAIGMKIRAGAAIDAVGLHCLYGSDTALAGGTGGQPHNIFCNGDEVLVGVLGYENNGRVQALGAICQDEYWVLAGTRTTMTADSMYGNWTGTYFERLCPLGMAVTGVRGRSGSRVDRLQLDCQHINGQVELPNDSFLASVGGSGGTQKLEECVGRSALVGLTFQTGNHVNRLGGQCSPISTVCTGSGCTERVGWTVHPLPSHGGTNGVVGEQRCATGSALIGLRFRTGTYVNAVSAVCADVEVWSGTAPYVITNLPLVGGTGGTFVTRTCPRGSFLTGWAIRSGSLVDALSPLCREF